MNIGDRSRVRLLDKLAKQHGWRSLCIVGVKDDLEAKSMIQWCRNLAVTVVWQQRRDGTRQERQRQQMARDRMRKWTAVYKRLSLVEMSPADAAEELADRQYDAVALWGLSPAELAFTGAQWAALVRDGGSLVGTGHRLPEVRGILNAAVPKWRQLRDGVWLVEVKRTAAHAEKFLALSFDDSDGHSADGVNFDVDAVGGAHDPVDSELGDVDEAGAAPVTSPRDRGRADVERVAVSEDAGDEPVGVEGGSAADLVDDILADGNAPSIPDQPDATLAIGGSELHGDTIAPPAPKRRGGRPKGSRNKPKVAQ